MFATNAQTEAYEEYYVKDTTTTAGNAPTMVSKFVKDKIKLEYASDKNKKVGLASIVASADGETITISTTDFEEKGTISEKGGTLTWSGIVIKTNTNNWANKSAVFVGDSITYGIGTEEGKRYWEFLKEELDLSSVTGMGISGSCISAQSDYGTSNTPLINRYNNITNADLITIFMGTNDYGHETPLGTITDNTDVSFYGALNVIIPSLIETHKDSRIVFVTPMHRYGFGKSNITGNNFTYDNLPNGLGYTLKDYVDAIKEVCNKYSITVIDLFSASELDASDSTIRATYFPDGLHPNAAGHKIIANLIKENLNNIQPSIGNNTSNTEESEDIELQKGNSYRNVYIDSSNRASTVKNVYLEANTIISLKNSTYKYGIYTQTNSNIVAETDSITGGWTTSHTAISQDGWYGIAFCRVDDANFDFNNIDSNKLSDYIKIEKISLTEKDRLIQKGNEYNSTSSNNRASIINNVYLEAHTTINLKNNAYKYALYSQTGSNIVSNNSLITGGWITTDYEISQDGWYGIAFCRADDADFDFNNNDSNKLLDYIEY